MLSSRKEPRFAIDFECDKQSLKDTTERKWSIVIHDLLLHCKIGVYPHEFNNNQKVLVNLECDYFAPSPQPNTDVSQILCYDTLVKAIQTIAAKDHIYFMENFVEAISDHCLSDSRVQKVKISAMKINALDAAKSVGVKITRRKQTKVILEGY